MSLGLLPNKSPLPLTFRIGRRRDIWYKAGNCLSQGCALVMTSHTTYGSGRDVFWGEISPCEHLVQIYDTDSRFLDTLEAFVAQGVRAGESVIVIATPAHRSSLHQRLEAASLNVTDFQARDQLVLLDAEETLQMFMRNDWPDEKRFFRLVNGLIACAKRDGRKVRAFGEMVAILCARGNWEATVQLEKLWNQLCLDQKFPLLCAYPRAGFTQDASSSLSDICAAHSRTLPQEHCT
jgi:hypothetical protein